MIIHCETPFIGDQAKSKPVTAKFTPSAASMTIFDIRLTPSPPANTSGTVDSGLEGFAALFPGPRHPQHSVIARFETVRYPTGLQERALSNSLSAIPRLDLVNVLPQPAVDRFPVEVSTLHQPNEKTMVIHRIPDQLEPVHP